MQPLPLGTSDFKAVIEGGRYYVDKTLMIPELIQGASITLLPRPRRFGKTLNLSMLNYFFTNQADYRHLFSGLAIEKDAEAMAHCGQYPVILVSFKDVKTNNFSDCIAIISNIIQRLFLAHRYLLTSDALSDAEKQHIEQFLAQRTDGTKLAESILTLSGYLHRHHQKEVVILIDEYDMPVNSAYSYGYYDELIGFLRNLLSGAFKDNPHLFKGVLTGILRIARESIFSGLNNLDVCTLTNERYRQYFGFTEQETEQLLVDYELSYELQQVRKWYNGYNFGGLTIYNPWSIISLAMNKGKLSPYWINTSDNQLIRDLIGKASPSVKQEVELLLSQTPVRKTLSENIVFRDIEGSDDALWNFLLFSGYLRYQDELFDDATGIVTVNLSIPNQEVHHFFLTAILSWFQAGNNGPSLGLPDILHYLLTEQLEYFAEGFEQFVEEAFSYFDVTNKKPELFYHAFVLGMLVQLKSSHTIKSNRESGLGRYDVCLIPHDKSQAGFVFEFKKLSVRNKETLESACDAALAQIESRHYASELVALGITTVHQIGIAFDGKIALVKWV